MTTDQIDERTLVIETTRKGKHVRSYGPFTPHEAGEFALSKIELQNLNGGRHEFVLEVLPESPWSTLPPEAPRGAGDNDPDPLFMSTSFEEPVAPGAGIRAFMDWMDTLSEEPTSIFGDRISTADLDQRDRFPNRPLTDDDVAFPNDPWPTQGKHRKPWAGN